MAIPCMLFKKLVCRDPMPASHRAVAVGVQALVHRPAEHVQREVHLRHDDGGQGQLCLRVRVRGL